MTKSNKKLLNMKTKHVGITVINQQLEFYYLIDIIHTKFRKFNFRASYISLSRVLNFAIFLKTAKIAKFSTRKIK